MQSASRDESVRQIDDRREYFYAGVAFSTVFYQRDGKETHRAGCKSRGKEVEFRPLASLSTSRLCYEQGRKSSCGAAL